MSIHVKSYMVLLISTLCIAVLGFVKTQKVSRFQFLLYVILIQTSDYLSIPIVIRMTNSGTGLINFVPFMTCHLLT